jgi:hypothetical protein
VLLSQSAEQPKLHYLLGKPGLSSNLSHYGRAKDILHSSHVVSLIEEDEAADFGTALEKSLASPDSPEG